MTLKDKIDEYTREVAEKRAKILDDFAKAYLAERMGDNPNFKVSDLELIEQRNTTDGEFKTIFYFRIKRGRKKLINKA